jgi:low affinity Fe/Cu permease
MMTFEQRLTRALDAFATAPLATLLSLGFTIVWLVCGFTMRFSEAWLLAMSTTSAVVTLVMVFVIANAQRRNTAALHLKIDMLVEAHPELSNRAVGVEHKPDQHIFDMRDELHARVSEAERAEAD